MAPQPQQYTLYHHPFSSCSLMVRYTLAIAGTPQDADSAMEIDEQIIHIYDNGQLDEHFLTHINPKGQVPVLASPELEKPMADSLAITLYLAERYSALIPAAHNAETTDLLRELHDLNYFSLSFGQTRPQMAHSFIAAIDARLAETGNSEEYRSALQYKRNVTTEMKVKGVETEVIEHNNTQAKALMAKLEATLQAGKPWLFGAERPGALDTHLVVFLARMKEVRRTDLLSARLDEYLLHATSTAEWQGVTGGKGTMPEA